MGLGIAMTTSNAQFGAPYYHQKTRSVDCHLRLAIRYTTGGVSCVERAQIDDSIRFDSTSSTLIPFYVGSTHEELVGRRDQFTYAPTTFGAQPEKRLIFIAWLVRRIAAAAEANNFVTTTE